MQHLNFEHNFQKKVMHQSWAEPSTITNDLDVQKWREAWTAQLKSWHSPYKVLVDCSNLKIVESPEVAASLTRMFRFFEGFFMRKAIAYSPTTDLGLLQLPVQIITEHAESLKAVGLGPKDGTAQAGDLRAKIQIENHFKTHCVEVSFNAPVQFNSKEDLQVLRSKLTNNLMQWHSKWNLLIDCTDVSFANECDDEFARMQSFFKGLFLKQTIGYAANPATQHFPFQVFRARHKAVAHLENEGLQGGDEADCLSKKA